MGLTRKKWRRHGAVLQLVCGAASLGLLAGSVALRGANSVVLGIGSAVTALMILAVAYELRKDTREFKAGEAWWWER